MAKYKKRYSSSKLPDPLNTIVDLADAVSKGNAKKEDLMLPDGSECWSSVSWSKISDVPEKRINNITTYIKYQSMVKYLAENTCYDKDGKKLILSPIEYDFWVWN